jgi:arylsulfatase A-like enzyme
MPRLSDGAKSRKVLFISADQWRWECLSALGHPVVKTPNLDALAADGVLFRNHFAQATPCGPARASMLTGLYLMNHRSCRNGTPLDARHTNLALEARRGGYDPTLFGYTDSSADPRGRDPEDPALKTYEGVLPGMTVGVQVPDHAAPWMAYLKSRGYDFPNGRFDVYKPRSGYNLPEGRGFRAIPTIFSAEDSETTFMADTFLRWLSIRGGLDWFAHLVFLRPHPPIIAPEPYNLLYHPKDVPAAIRAATSEIEGRQHPFLKEKLKWLGSPNNYDEHNPLNLVDMGELDLSQMRATYYAMMTQVDHQIGRIVAALKGSGEYDNTLIIFTCDHGEMLGDHYCWGKEIYFDSSFHIPLIVRDPRAAADGTRGATVGRFTEAVDLMPTILDWLELEAPRTCDGSSLLPFLEGKQPADWRTEAHFEHDFRDIPNLVPETAFGLHSDDCNYAVIRGDRYKYVHFAAMPALLFDLENDPGETKNLADDPAHRDVMLDYAQKMLSWRLRHADRTLTGMHLTSKGVVSRR